MPPPFILDPKEFLDTIVADIEGAEGKHNPRDSGNGATSAIALVDTERQLIVGYKDVHDEFGSGADMPSELCPSAFDVRSGGQLAAWYCSHVGLVAEGQFIAFGGDG
ncbi:MAG: hypothetical protein U1D30_19250 [Planctomycetota bacterium]